MAAPTPDRARLLELLRSLSFSRRPVTLASGEQSDLYVDCKQTALHPEGAWALGHHLLAAVESIEARTGRRATAVGGMSIGADPLATAVSLVAHLRGRHLPAFLVRKTPKAHGTAVWLEGMANLEPGADIVLLEDVITTGGSTLKAAERVREEGLDPFGVAVIVDREAGGRAALGAAGLEVESLYTLSTLAKGS